MEEWEFNGITKITGEVIKVSLEDMFKKPNLDMNSKSWVNTNINLMREYYDCKYFFNESPLFIATGLNLNHVLNKYYKINFKEIGNNYKDLLGSYYDLVSKYVLLDEKHKELDKIHNQVVNFIKDNFIFKIKKDTLTFYFKTKEVIILLGQKTIKDKALLESLRDVFVRKDK